MFWLFYNLVFGLVFLLLIPQFLLRMRKRGGYRRDFFQRLGRYDEATAEQLQQPRLWIHAVSVGEVQVALRFIDLWRARFPEEQFMLSLTTSTAHKIAREKLNDSDCLIYFPVDFPLVLRRVFKTIQPQALVMVEAEIWPNLVRLCKKRGIPMALLNGRLSDRSYGRMRKARFLTRRVLPLVDLFCMQSEEEKQRMIELGAREASVHVLNSAKYEVAGRNPEKESEAAAAVVAAGILPEHTILMGGSTWPGEEEVLLNLYRHLREQHPALRLVLVPRHVERIPELLPTLDLDGFTLARRSEAPGETPADVFLLDTTGELMAFYSVADLIFVGKSLFENGGQNIIEPAVFGKPILVGPNMQNFPRVMGEFVQADAIRQVAGAEELGSAVQNLLEDRQMAEGLGENARVLVEQKAGALTRSVEMIHALLP